MTPRKPTHNALTKAEAKHFTPQQVERSLLKALAPALETKSGRVDLGGCPPRCRVRG